MIMGLQTVAHKRFDCSLLVKVCSFLSPVLYLAKKKKKSYPLSSKHVVPCSDELFLMSCIKGKKTKGVILWHLRL